MKNYLAEFSQVLARFVATPFVVIGYICLLIAWWIAIDRRKHSSMEEWIVAEFKELIRIR